MDAKTVAKEILADLRAEIDAGRVKNLGFDVEKYADVVTRRTRKGDLPPGTFTPETIREGGFRVWDDEAEPPILDEIPVEVSDNPIPFVARQHPGVEAKGLVCDRTTLKDAFGIIRRAMEQEGFTHAVMPSRSWSDYGAEMAHREYARRIGDERPNGYLPEWKDATYSLQYTINVADQRLKRVGELEEHPGTYRLLFPSEKGVELFLDKYDQIMSAVQNDKGRPEAIAI